MPVPPTRASLLLRIRDAEDHSAWQEFEAIYRPVIRQMAINQGMQPADVDDLTQQVMIAVSEAIERFEPNQQRAKFRTWLKTIARRAIINALTRRRPDYAAGGSGMLDLLHQHPIVGNDSALMETQYRREIFLVAASIIREEFRESTWQAFWQTVVLDQTVESASRALGCTKGSVYTSRSRVLRRLREKVQELDLNSEHESS